MVKLHFNLLCFGIGWNSTLFWEMTGMVHLYPAGTESVPFEGRLSCVLFLATVTVTRTGAVGCCTLCLCNNYQPSLFLGCLGTSAGAPPPSSSRSNVPGPKRPGGTTIKSHVHGGCEAQHALLFFFKRPQSVIKEERFQIILKQCSSVIVIGQCFWISMQECRQSHADFCLILLEFFFCQLIFV